MFAFVTSIRHPHNSNDYARVWRLLVATLRSVCNQTDPSFSVFVVCNERRPLPADLARVQVLEVVFPPPTEVAGAATDMAAIRRDRGTKYVIGLLAAREAGAENVLFFDADDFVHRELVSEVHRRHPRAGWTIDKGYRYKTGRIKEMDQFHRGCGTCNILRTELWLSGVPRTLTTASSQPAIQAAVEPDMLHLVIGSHKFAADHFRARGHRLRALPLRAAAGTSTRVRTTRTFAVRGESEPLPTRM